MIRRIPSMNAPQPPWSGNSISWEHLVAGNDFASLGSRFAVPTASEPLPAPYLVAASRTAASLLGLEPAQLESPRAVAVLAGNETLAGSEPVATIYSGHQFGVWAGQLGDGRALLLGDFAGAQGGRLELQLKGAGLTPFSRMGDGRAVLRSSIREFLCSEAMAALGIPTTRALAVIGADLPVFRETVETAAVVSRLAPSFLRFGHFEHFYRTGQHQELRRLADYLIDRFLPQCRDAAQPYQAMLAEIVCRTASLIAHWQAVGFCHGVMNTDNMSMLGLTIDYGPFGFLDGFDAHHICNHSDSGGRYSYANQPAVAEWNCYCLAQSMVPLLGSVDEAKDALQQFRPAFAEAFRARFQAKLGLREQRDGDDELLDKLFTVMHQGRIDFTLFFRRLADIRSNDASADVGVRDLFADRASFDGWVQMYRARLVAESSNDLSRRAAMNAVNPKYVLRNHLAEQAIRRARGGDERSRLQLGTRPPSEPGAVESLVERQDFSEVHRLLQILSKPFDEQPEYETYAQLPPDWASELSVSCSS
jgi:uncharacterized protein YdiU (UPF0061 family)